MTETLVTLGPLELWRRVLFWRTNNRIRGPINHPSAAAQRRVPTHPSPPRALAGVRRMRAQVMRTNGDQITLPRTTGRHLLSSPVHRLCLFVDNSVKCNQRGRSFYLCALFKRPSKMLHFPFLIFLSKLHETLTYYRLNSLNEKSLWSRSSGARGSLAFVNKANSA